MLRGRSVCVCIYCSVFCVSMCVCVCVCVCYTSTVRQRGREGDEVGGV